MIEVKNGIIYECGFELCSLDEIKKLITIAKNANTLFKLNDFENENTIELLIHCIRYGFIYLDYDNTGKRILCFNENLVVIKNIGDDKNISIYDNSEPNY